MASFLCVRKKQKTTKNKVEKLKAKKKYYVRVRAYKSASGKHNSKLFCQRHIRVHIRAQQEGIVQFTARCSARSPHIRPQRKFACSRSFQISFISVPSFPVKLFPTHLQTGTSICSVPGSKTFAFFFPLGLWICCLHYILSYLVCQ